MHLVVVVGGLKLVSLCRGLTIWGMTRGSETTGRDLIENVISLLVESIDTAI